MSSLAPTKREIPTNSVPSKTGALAWLKPFFGSTVGMKFTVAVTGLLLTAFVIVHMVGNLLIFAGPTAINEYAHKLKSSPEILWTARIGLLLMFVTHMIVAIRLQIRSKQARPVPYDHQATIQASFASRQMMLTGILILAFVVFHIAHFTCGFPQQAHIPAGTIFEGTKTPNDGSVSFLVLRDSKNHHDVYSMVIYGFSNPVVAVTYAVAQLFLFVHLLHGVASVFQTLGINTPRTTKVHQALAWLVAIAVVGGNLAIVGGVAVSSQSGVMQPEHRNPFNSDITGRIQMPNNEKK